MLMPQRHLIALPLLAFSATTAWAQDDTLCRNGLFPSEPPFALAEIAGETRAYFHDDMNGCPWRGENCKTGSYVIPGDTVIINRLRGGYACAFYPSERGGTAGWIPTRRLGLLPVETNSPLSAWLGEWSSEGNPTIRFRKRLGRLHIEGEAYWPSPDPEPDSPYPSPHVGAIDGRVTLLGNRGHYGDEDLCEVHFTLLGDLLVAGDNRQCGGMNVSFSAVYQRVESWFSPSQ